MQYQPSALSFPQISQASLDPALISLPFGDDKDLSDPPTIAAALGHTATRKVAGSRHVAKHTLPKGKGHSALSNISKKRKAEREQDHDADEKPAKRGRPTGAVNYADEDVTALLDFVEHELPLGQRGWLAVHMEYMKWAQLHGRPERTLKSLETKFKQV